MDKYAKLLISLGADAIGMASMFFGLAEFLDLIWAPVQAGIIQYLFDDVYLATLGLVEELGPYTDVIPACTLAWYLHYHKNYKKR